MTLTPKQIADGGWIKVPGGDVYAGERPEGYADDDVVDLFCRLDFTHLALAGDFNWVYVTHHRRHISDREQIDMAIDVMTTCDPNNIRTGVGDRIKYAETIKLLKERQHHPAALIMTKDL